MKKILIGVLIFPVLIFAVGLILVFAGKGLNIFSSPESPESSMVLPEATDTGTKARDGSTSPAPRQITAPNIINDPTEYYIVTGATKEEIRASKFQSKKGTFFEGHDAATVAQTSINFRRRQLADKCEAVLTQFDLHMGFIYPKWITPPSASPEVITAWNAFIAALVVHEERHAEIELKNILDTFTALTQMPSYATCEEFDRAWQEIAETRERKDREDQAEYDRETRSGRLQGVSF
ncbi:MAG: DUF922 domain-containing protein [bacterium]|nr:DUF922 domain-containing protein [bacterium]MDZ4296077.1 DUF922 domain-containing protein [Patescibacteria group bacterium]